jgi:hypothetical protein
MRNASQRILVMSVLASGCLLSKIRRWSVGESRWNGSLAPKTQPQKERHMRKPIHLFAIVTALVAAIALPAAASASVAPGTYTPTAGSFDSANAPGSSHLTSGSPSCTVNADLSISCSSYVLGGVGHTNADVSLTASYSATIDCFNGGTNKNNPVESHTSNFSASSSATVTSSKNGQLSVPAQSVSPFGAAQVCPNPNWTPRIRTGTLTLDGFDYRLTFAGFTSPYIEITA